MGGFDLRAHVDPGLPLSALSTSIHERFERIDHFVLRYEHCLPVLRSDSSDPLHRIVAAYICHQPYRSLTENSRLHPFRDAILSAAGGANDLSHLLLQFVHASSEELKGLAALPLSSLWQHQQQQATTQRPPNQDAHNMLAKATQRTLSMGEQRSLLSKLQSTPPVLRVVDSVSPAQLVLVAANHPILTTELVICISRDLLVDSSAKAVRVLQLYCEALSKLPPTARSFDVITRLLRSNAAAPAPIPGASAPLKTSVAHTARLYILGAFISNSITFLEQSEAQQESLIITDLNESGLAPFDRREVDARLEEAMARQVGSFCHFVTSLLNSALLFPPDLGSLRRDISTHVDLNPQELRKEVQDMESELQSMTEATLVELKHFALRFGRYGDGTRLFSQLSSLV